MKVGKMGKGYWEPLRVSGIELLKSSPRLSGAWKELSTLVKAPVGRIDLVHDAKVIIRNDIYNSYDWREAYEYAKTHYGALDSYSDKELEWILDWKQSFFNFPFTDPDYDDSSDEEYVPLHYFDGVETLDWLLYRTICGERPDDLPLGVTLTAVLTQLQRVRREFRTKEKIDYIRQYISENRQDIDDFFTGKTDGLQVMLKRDSNKSSVAEVKSYWYNHLYLPKMARKGSKEAIQAFVEAQGRDPLTPEEAMAYLPEEFKKFYQPNIRWEIKNRILNKVLRKQAKEAPIA